MIDTAYIGLGANLGEPELQIREAIDKISSLKNVWLLGCSSLYRTTPVGFPGQPDFVNAVISVETSLPPNVLLNSLLGIEKEMGRTPVPEERDQPRVIDCDLLMYGDEERDEAKLQLPHPRMNERLFVLAPLRELVPGIRPPGTESIDLLCQRCREAGQHAETIAEF